MILCGFFALFDFTCTFKVAVIWLYVWFSGDDAKCVLMTHIPQLLFKGTLVFVCVNEHTLK